MKVNEQINIVAIDKQLDDWYPYGFSWIISITYILLSILNLWDKKTSPPLSFLLVFIAFVYLFFKRKKFVQITEDKISYLEHPVTWLLLSPYLLSIFLYAMGYLGIGESFVFGTSAWLFISYFYSKTNSYTLFILSVIPPFSNSPFYSSSTYLKTNIRFLLYTYFSLPVMFIILISFRNFPTNLEFFLMVCTSFIITVGTVHHTHVKLIKILFHKKNNSD
jgi:hypothetical protein